MGRGQRRRLQVEKIRRGRGDGRGRVPSASGPRTASGCTPRSSDPTTATRSCWPTASPARSGSGPTRSPTCAATTASSPSITAATAVAPCPRGRSGYSLDHLAGDLDAVLEATLAPGERAVIAGPFDGRHHDLVVGGPVPRSGAATRRRRRPDQHHHRATCFARAVLSGAAAARRRPGFAAASTLLKTFGAAPLVVQRSTGRAGGSSSTIAVGRDADPAIAEFVYDCSTRRRPRAAAAGPARLSTRWGCTSTSG